LQLSRKARANQVTKVGDQIRSKRLKFSNCWKYGPDGSFQDFWNFIEVNFVNDPKTGNGPYDLLSHHTNPQN
jgi:hypothetical protein